MGVKSHLSKEVILVPSVCYANQGGRGSAPAADEPAIEKGDVPEGESS